MNRFAASRDLTDKTRHIQATPAPHLSWLCGHRKPRAGGKLRAGMLWRCVDCAQKLRAQ